MVSVCVGFVVVDVVVRFVQNVFLIFRCAISDKVRSDFLLHCVNTTKPSVDVKNRQKISHERTFQVYYPFFNARPVAVIRATRPVEELDKGTRFTDLEPLLSQPVEL